MRQNVELWHQSIKTCLKDKLKKPFLDMAAQEDSFNGNVFFLGVARASIDRSLLAEYQYQGHIDSVAVAQMLRVFSDALVPGQSYSFSAGDCSWSLKEGFKHKIDNLFTQLV